MRDSIKRRLITKLKKQKRFNAIRIVVFGKSKVIREQAQWQSFISQMKQNGWKMKYQTIKIYYAA